MKFSTSHLWSILKFPGHLKSFFHSTNSPQMMKISTSRGMTNSLVSPISNYSSSIKLEISAHVWGNCHLSSFGEKLNSCWKCRCNQWKEQLSEH
jgi:hypothetical protein